MSIYLHKILPVLILPTGLVILLLLAGLLLRRRWPLWTALALFWLCCTPVVSDALMTWVEGGGPRLEAAEMPSADAIVVLGEGRDIAPGPAAVSEWIDGDRFWGGIALYQAGKAPLLVFTGGWLPWAPSAPPEGEVLMRYARKLGVPEIALHTTGKVVNTEAEAQAVAELLRQKSRTRVLLVTSAFHMPRALKLFQETGLVVTPFRVDYQVDAAEEFTVRSLIPRAEKFRKTEIAWREMIGRAWYALR
jgi:uncharacterized SAM-binding protein YcdF (DUF218 family)